MGSIDIIKPLSTVLSRAINKSLQHRINSSKILRKKIWEREELNHRPLGAKRERYLLCYALPHSNLYLIEFIEAHLKVVEDVTGGILSSLL